MRMRDKRKGLRLLLKEVFFDSKEAKRDVISKLFGGSPANANGTLKTKNHLNDKLVLFSKFVQEKNCIATIAYSN